MGHENDRFGRVFLDFGEEVIALALNTQNCTIEEAITFRDFYESSLKIPVLLPLEEGCDKFLPVIKGLIEQSQMLTKQP